MADNKKLLVVYRDMPKCALTEEVDIILTPQFYSLKKEALPIKYGFQAKRIAASIFEGMLEEKKVYQYFVFKEEKMWVFIAYCIDDILRFLESKQIDLTMVNRLFFAEQFAQNFQTPYRLNKDDALVVIDHTVVLLPNRVIGDEVLSSTFDQGSSRPKKGIMLSRASSLLFSTKQATTLAAIFLIMAFLYLVEGSRYDSSASSSAMQTYEVLVSSNPSLESQYKRESILKKYQKIDTAERTKREMIKSLGRMITKGVTLKSINLDDKGLKAYLVIKDTPTRKKMEAIAKSAQLNVTKPDSTSGIHIEGKL
jgi:hypothetical protein